MECRRHRIWPTRKSANSSNRFWIWILKNIRMFGPFWRRLCWTRHLESGISDLEIKKSITENSSIPSLLKMKLQVSEIWAEDMCAYFLSLRGKTNGTSLIQSMFQVPPNEINVTVPFKTDQKTIFRCVFIYTCRPKMACFWYPPFFRSVYRFRIFRYFYMASILIHFDSAIISIWRIKGRKATIRNGCFCPCD